MQSLIRFSLAALGLILLVMALAIGLDLAGGRALWPWPDGRLSYIFIFSIFAAQGSALLWQAFALQPVAVSGGAAGFVLMYAGQYFPIQR